MSKRTEIKSFKFRSCKCKKPYPSLYIGLKALLKHRENGWTVDSLYKCIFCKQYHIGTVRPHTKKRLEKVQQFIGELNGA